MLTQVHQHYLCFTCTISALPSSEFFQLCLEKWFQINVVYSSLGGNNKSQVSAKETKDLSSFGTVWLQKKYLSLYILSETSKPPLDIFSYILTDMKHTRLQFTLNMEKSNKQNLSKFHVHKLKLTCSIDRLYKGTIAFHFRTNAKI